MDLRSYDFSEPVPNRLVDGAIIHLHGSIRLAKEENIKSSLVLGEGSYVTQYVVQSPWYAQFERDIAFASALFIVGYSLADYHIAALLMKNPELANRTFFIQGPEFDPILERRTRDYGRAFFVGAEKFSKALDSLPRHGPSRDLMRLRSFKSLSPTKDPKSVTKPTATEVYDLLVYGNFDPSAFGRSLPGDSYVFKRPGPLSAAVNALARSRSLIIDARIGNGKSIFQRLLASELLQGGYSCFMFRPGRPDVSAEIALLRETEKVVIFMDEYAIAQDSLEGLATALPDAKFVVEVATGTLEVRYHEVVGLVPRPFERVSLGRLDTGELSAFARLCSMAGLTEPTRKTKELREFLIELFQSRFIRERIERALTPLFQTASARQVVVAAMIISSHQGYVPAGFLRSVLKVDPFDELNPFADVASEILEISTEGFRIRSSIFSQFVLREFVDRAEIGEVVGSLIRSAAQRKTQRQYRTLLSKLMAYGGLRSLFGSGLDVNRWVLDLYEQLRHDQNVSAEPLFWLQFAIAMSDVPRLDAAHEYIQTAYRRAAALPGFETYQIDTQAFRIVLLKATEEPIGSAIAPIVEIIDGMEKINKMVSDSSHRAYAVKVLENVLPFALARADDFSAGERIAVGFWLRKIEQSLANLPNDFKMATASDEIKRKMALAAEAISSARRDR
ncbi:hypothetical protein FHY09_003038 [Xanthomonas sp. 60]